MIHKRKLKKDLEAEGIGYEGQRKRQGEISRDVGWTKYSDYRKSSTK